MKRTLSTLFSFSALCTPLLAQLVGGQSEDLYSTSPGGMSCDVLVVGPDLNGDGIAEFAAGYGADFGGTSRVRIHDGATGALRLELVNTTMRNYGRSLAFSHDADGDGLLDLAIGASHASTAAGPNSGKIEVRSAVSGALLQEVDGDPGTYLGYGLAAVGDLDGDGVGDYLAEAPSFSWGIAAEVQLRSGATGAVLRRHYRALLSSKQGMPDLDGDGVAEYFLREEDHRDYVVSLISGATGTTIRTHQGARIGEDFGYAIASTGDLDGDGTEDYLISTPGYTTSTLTDCGAVSAWSGSTGALLWEHVGEEDGLWLGLELEALDDLDGDGVDDLLCAQPSYWLHYKGQGHARLLSGSDGSLIGDRRGQASWEQLGHAISGMADIDGDGRGEFLLSVAARVIAVSFKPGMAADVRELSSATGGQVRYELRFPAEEAGRPYQWLASASGTGPWTVGGIQVPLSYDAMLFATLSQSLEPLVQNADGRLDAQAEATVLLDLGPGAASAWVGTTLHFAAVTHAGGFPRVSSVAVPLQILP